MKSIIEIAEPSKEYELLDSGEGYKLERFGEITLSRPDPEALWEKKLDKKVWQNADAEFVRSGKSGDWKSKNPLPKSWNIELGGFTFSLKPNSFKHVGIFPEQSENWKWIEETISKSKIKSPKVLNLFAYTGGATLAALRAGAEVVHVDASKQAIEWTKENVKLSGLEEKSVRYIIDDAVAFLKREVRRGNTYDAIIMDPPAFGRGPKNEEWKIEKDFSELISLTFSLISTNPIFFLVNGYTAGYSGIGYRNSLLPLVEKFGGEIEHGELVIAEKSGKRFLPAGIFARWSK
jgi:23S rRNA (cytosine1962-C5)-methyltransferase